MKYFGMARSIQEGLQISVRIRERKLSLFHAVKRKKDRAE